MNFPNGRTVVVNVEGILLPDESPGIMVTVTDGRESLKAMVPAGQVDKLVTVMREMRDRACEIARRRPIP